MSYSSNSSTKVRPSSSSSTATTVHNQATAVSTKVRKDQTHFDSPKFVSAAVIAANHGVYIAKNSEISDDELLKMAIKCEMEHP